MISAKDCLLTFEIVLPGPQLEEAFSSVVFSLVDDLALSQKIIVGTWYAIQSNQGATVEKEVLSLVCSAFLSSGSTYELFPARLSVLVIWPCAITRHGVW